MDSNLVKARKWANARRNHKWKKWKGSYRAYELDHMENEYADPEEEDLEYLYKKKQGLLRKKKKTLESSSEEEENEFGGKYIDLSLPENETNEVVDLEEDEEYRNEILVKALSKMKCNICMMRFNRKERYFHHYERHFAPDHFICLICQKGFIKMSHVEAHELIEHNINKNKYSEREFKRRFKEAEKELETWIIPSTSLYPYRGPPVKDLYKPYQIEKDYGRHSTRASYSSAKAKVVHRRRLFIVDKIKKRDALESQNNKNYNKKTPLTINLDSDSDDESSEDEEKVQKVQKFYLCSICGSGGANKEDLENHGKKRHPDTELSKVIQVISLGSTSGQKTPPKKEKISKKSQKNKVIVKPLEFKKTWKSSSFEEHEKLKEIKFLGSLKLLPSRTFFFKYGIPNQFTNCRVKMNRV